MVYGEALVYTTAARGSLAVSTLPLLAMMLGGALAFYLSVYALQRTTPTPLANTVSPIAAALLAAVLLGESIGTSLVIGVAAVAAGIWIASTEAAGKIGRGERI